MGRHKRVLTAAALATAIGALAPAASYAQVAGRRVPVLQSVRAAVSTSVPLGGVVGGEISGTVSDEHGGPLAGVMVSVIGATMAMDVTDTQGRFSLERLPSGEYILAAQRQGFTSARRQLVRVGAGPLPAYRLQLHRVDAVVATSGTVAAPPSAEPPLASRPIIAAGFDLPVMDVPGASGSPDGHPHNETAWRIRHLPRSILKDAASSVPVEADPAEPENASMFSRAMDSAVSVASAIFNDIPFTGEVNLLTTSAFAPGTLFGGDVVPRGVAYLSIGSPTPAGDWQVRAAMGEGDLSSWIVAGSFVSRRTGIHSYDLGLSYSTQEYSGGSSPLTLGAITDGSRNVGELYALDRWTLSPGVSFEYGGRYAHYDYLSDRGLMSPRVGLTLEPTEKSRVTAVLAQRMLAPGAEEFVSPGAVGPWLPPERTFGAFRGEEMRVERARSLDVLFEHEFSGTYVVGVRRFFQSVDDQLATIFGMPVPQAPSSSGHYLVATAGNVDAQGWGVRLATAPSSRIQASVDYTLARTRWNSWPTGSQLGAFVPAAVRPQDEDIHDVTAQVHTSIPETSTRVFVLYKLNSAFTRPDLSQSRAGLDGRFDVQVNQALPFGVAGTQWEVLVGVRNLFRDPNDPASVYDELLVVRPPKRVVGGFLVRF
jgi:hypothetical protein